LTRRANHRHLFIITAIGSHHAKIAAIEEGRNLSGVRSRASGGMAIDEKIPKMTSMSASGQPR
jgi:hypothetical protein